MRTSASFYFILSYWLGRCLKTELPSSIDSSELTGPENPVNCIRAALNDIGSIARADNGARTMNDRMVVL